MLYYCRYESVMMYGNVDAIGCGWAYCGVSGMLRLQQLLSPIFLSSILEIPKRDSLWLQTSAAI